jgi:pantothenate kinase
VGIVIIGGNYLLLERSPWNSLRDLFDFTVLIETPPGILRDRRVDRWETIGLPPPEVLRKVAGNDLPNGMVVIEESAEPDFRLTN